MTPAPPPSSETRAPPPPARSPRDGRPLPAELQYLIIVLALFGLLLISGVPGAQEPEAGNGTGVLRSGWAEWWTEQAAARGADQDLVDEASTDASHPVEAPGAADEAADPAADAPR